MRYIYLTLIAFFFSLSAFASLGPITGSGNVCIGFTDTLTNSTSGGVWSSSNPSIASVGASSGIVTAHAAGVVTILYTIGGGSVGKLVTINSLPNVYNVFGGGAYCSGTGGVHIGVDGSELGVSYLLYYGSSVTGYAIGTGETTDFGTLTVGGVYTVLATNGITGCSSAMTGFASVTINPLVTPLVTVTASTGNTVCPGTTVLFTAVPADGGSAPTYLWNVNGTDVGTGSTYNFIPADGDVVKVKMTANATCASSELATDNVRMTVLPYETPSAVITADPGDTVCQYALAHLYVEGAFGGSIPLYSWFVNGVHEGAGTEFSYAPATGDIVTCQLTSNYLCRLANTVPSNGINMTVTPLVVPVVSIVSSPGLTINGGTSESLTAVVTNGGTHPTFQWEINGVPVNGATSATFTYNNFANYDSVTCIVTSSGFCDGISAFSWVYITISSTGVMQAVTPGGDVQLFPNPNKGIFAIKGAVGSADEHVLLQVTDMLGYIVYTREVNAVNGNINEQLSLANVASGMYILNLHTAAGNKAFHFVVEN